MRGIKDVSISETLSVRMWTPPPSAVASGNRSAFQAYQVISEKLLSGLDDFLFELCGAFRHPGCEVVHFLHVGPDSFAVQEKKDQQCRHSDGLVAVLKRMVFHHQVKQDAGL